LPVLLVGLRCPIEVIMERLRATGRIVGSSADAPIPRSIQLWQRQVHIPGIYDLEVDTAVLSPEACAAAIRQLLDRGRAPTAFQRLAALATRRE
jgi:chloramphenicol 3-O phosphotransferase